MVSGQLKNKIKKLWEEFWNGGVANPLTVIEQISFLMFARMLDMRESMEEKKWSRKNKGQSFPGVYFSSKNQHLRWNQLVQEADADKLLTIVRDEVFSHFRELGEQSQGTEPSTTKNTFDQYMKDASLMINKASLLVSAINMIDDLPLTSADTKGDLYEFLLSKLTTAGINGQFRTPRHIIELMVDLVLEGNHDEAISWVVGDPACGTGGFLVQFVETLRKHFTSPEGILRDDRSDEDKDLEEKDVKLTYTGDLIEPHQWKHIRNDMLHGFDFDITMLRVAAMNMMLHGIDNPDINYQDTLSTNFTTREESKRWAEDAFDLILANPPFKGSLDAEDVHKSLTGKVKTKKTELLFLVLMLRMLKLGGRCAVIVPDGVTFGSSKAHKAFREMLVEENQLEAVVSLPGGVFKPYAGVSTAILFFTKGGSTDDVWFYNVEHDGYSMDDKRVEVEDNDLPDARKRWARRNPKKDTDRTAKAFFVPKDELAGNDYDLSINRYKEVVYEAVEYDPPQEILQRLAKIEDEIVEGRKELEGMLSK